MRILIYGVPRVCENLADPNNCTTILEHCKVTDSPGECVIRMFGEATTNSIKGFPDTAYTTAYKTFHTIMPYGHKYLHSLVDAIMTNGWGGEGVWRIF